MDAYQIILKSKVEPNLTKLLTTTKDRSSAGSKSGKPRKGPTNRKKQPIKSYVTRSLSAKDGSTSSDASAQMTNAHQFDESISPMKNQVISAESVTQKVTVTPPVGNQSYCHSNIHNVPPYWYGLPFPYGPPQGSSSKFPCQPFPYPPQGNGLPFPYPLTVYGHQVSADSSDTSDQYVIKFLNNRIKKCRGCGGNFIRKTDGSLPDPPMNLIVSRTERRSYTDGDNVEKLSKKQNVYYHPTLSCIKKVNASFDSSLLVKDPALTLTDVHKTYLSQYLNWYEP